MNASSLLVELKKRGVGVSFSGDSLLFDAPRGAMRELMPEVARLKPALLELLAHGDRFADGGSAEAASVPFAPPEVTDAARARGVVVTSYGWPVCYWSGDYAEELKAARNRKETHK